MESSDSDSSYSSDGWLDGIRQHDPDSEHSSLIPGLPDDISILCLARVPRQYHSVMKCVSTRWRDVVSCEQLYSYRRKHNLEEAWVYALGRDMFDRLCCYVLDPTRPARGWKRIRGMPSCWAKRKGLGFEVSGERLYLFGGCGWIENATDEAHCYDAAMTSWSIAARMSVARCYFACAAVNDKIFAIGGLGPKSSNPLSWDAYNPQTNSWKSHADPNFLRDIEDSVVFDGKIYVRCGSPQVSPHVYAIAYEPSSGTWEDADPDMVRGWRGPAVVVDGTLYVLNQTSGTKMNVLNQTSGTKMMKWQKDTKQWVSVGRFSSKVTRPPCRLVRIGKNILIIGQGLNTALFCPENAGEIVTLALPARSTSDIEVISCRPVAT